MSGVDAVEGGRELGAVGVEAARGIQQMKASIGRVMRSERCSSERWLKIDKKRV